MENKLIGDKEKRNSEQNTEESKEEKEEEWGITSKKKR